VFLRSGPNADPNIPVGIVRNQSLKRLKKSVMELETIDETNPEAMRLGFVRK
jgi:hypothetical protein